MRIDLRKSLIILLFISISGLLLIESQNQVAASTPAQTQSPASQFTEWEEWSAPISAGQFDITRCSPDLPATDRIFLGEFNGDNRPDLLCIFTDANGYTTPYVQIAGQDSYSAWEAWRTVSVQPGCEINLIADYNGDGLDDWFCTILWQGVYESFFFASRGDSFTGVGYMIARGAATQFNPHRCQAFEVADVNMDGREDTICHYLYADNSSGTLMATYDDDFSHVWDPIAPVFQPNSFDLRACEFLDSGDIDGNGEPDQICSYQYQNGQSATWVQLSLGGSFSGWIRWSEYAAAAEFELDQCHYMHVVDVDGDELLDLLCMYQDGINTGILVQTDSPATTGLRYGAWESWFELATDIIGCQQFSSDTPAVIDINGDGMSDILCAYRNSASTATTWVQLSTGSEYGDWQAWTPAQSITLDKCHVMLAADVNGDSHTDLICPYRHTSGSTSTQVQRVNLYKIALPIIVR